MKRSRRKRRRRPAPARLDALVTRILAEDEARRVPLSELLRPLGDMTEYIAQSMARSGGDDDDGPKVRLAKELMDAALPQGGWRQMGVRAVRKGCEQEAKTRRVPLPSPDSFSRAMGRRRK